MPSLILDPTYQIEIGNAELNDAAAFSMHAGAADHAPSGTWTAFQTCAGTPHHLFEPVLALGGVRFFRETADRVAAVSNVYLRPLFGFHAPMKVFPDQRV